MTEFVPLHAFKQTYFQGYRFDWAEPVLGFPKGQSPSTAVRNVLDGKADGKFILLIVPNGRTKKFDGQPNEYCGMCYAVIECASQEHDTARLLRNFPDNDAALRDQWAAAWPRSLQILQWYDIAPDRMRRFEDLHPKANHEAMVARGKLRRADWLTEAAGLSWINMNKRPVWPI